VLDIQVQDHRTIILVKGIRDLGKDIGLGDWVTTSMGLRDKRGLDDRRGYTGMLVGP
jgi:hypothetical protein